MAALNSSFAPVSFGPNFRAAGHFFTILFGDLNLEPVFRMIEAAFKPSMYLVAVSKL